MIRRRTSYLPAAITDVFYAAGLTAAEQMNYGEQGILIPLEELIEEYAPNFKALMDEIPEIRKSITAPDGHIYSLPAVDLSQHWYRNPLWYNGDFLKALNIDKLPETTEELYTFLKRVKKRIRTAMESPMKSRSLPYRRLRPMLGIYVLGFLALSAFMKTKFM